MTDDRVQHLLDQLLDSDATPEEVCESCPELLAVVRDRWLQMRRVRAELDALFPLNDGPGSHIGPYKLLQQIGEGGFGIVFMAEQDQPVRRRVAFKIIKPGMDSAQVIARFEAERQALAMMDHQNIAKVYDAGTTAAGRPYFVMELVQGVPITSYCDDNRLTVRERLGLFVAICKAVQHAHQKGIIHRDLKPGNVLVCLYDSEPVPKVIDFGVAKATEQNLTERSIFTQFGQVIGTFEYMSPEQAEMSQLGVDTRSDIYSLGVMLYELLTGSTPLQRHRFHEAGMAEVLRMVKEEEPPRPSARLSGSQEVGKIAAARRIEPVKLAKALRGELDWVVMKCLEKDRTRRYDTANGLARDIERYLHDEPVEAGPPGAAYRLRKLTRKHRTALGIASLVAMLLVLTGAVCAWQAVRATLAEHRALAERDRAEQEKDRAEHERNRAEASFKMARDTVDRFFTQVGESAELKAHGTEKLRKDLLQNAKDFYERFIRDHLDAPEVRHDLGLAQVRLAKIDEILGNYPAAQASSEKAIEIFGDLARAHPEASQYQPDLAAGYFALGTVYFDTGRSGKAEEAYQQALAIHEKLAADHPEVAEHRRALAMTQSALGLLNSRFQQLEKAQVRLELALATLNQLVGKNGAGPEDRHGLATVQQRLGAVYAERGQSLKAEAMLNAAASTYQALVGDYPDAPEYQHSLGSVYRALGGVYINNLRQADKAEAALQQARQIFEKLAQDHPDTLEFVFDVGTCHANLAVAAEFAGQFEVALSQGQRAIDILEPVLARGYRRARSVILDARLYRATALVGRGDHVRATDEANAVAREEGLAPINLYNLACVFANSSAAAAKDGKLTAVDRTRLKALYADHGMEFLRQAVAKGFQDPASVKIDPDLAPLHSRKDFQELLQEVERKSKK
jgi:serine/threonine protein kinase/tetratricopeptide (TPR) repeat protein